MTGTQRTTLVAAILGSGIATIDGSVVNVAAVGDMAGVHLPATIATKRAKFTAG